MVAEDDESTPNLQAAVTKVDVFIPAPTPATHLNFDGVNDVVDLGNTMSTVLDGINTFTVEAYVRPTFFSGYGVIIGNYSYPSSNSEMQFLLRRDGSHYTFWIDHGAGFVSVYAVNAVTLNSWQHVAAIWNGTKMEIYVDGISKNTNVTTSASGASFKTTTNKLVIGRNTLNENFTGDIDEVRIWKKVRTASEILSNKGVELLGSETDLLAYYKFNQGINNADNTSITSLTDATGNNYNGTLTNFNLTGTTSNWAHLASNTITPDTTPASFENSTPSSASIAETGFTLNTDINEAGKIYYVVLADNATAPTSTEVKAGTGNGGSSAVTAANASVTTGAFTNAFAVTGLTLEIAYDVYVVAEDDEVTPNLQTIPTKIEVTTTETIPPVFENSTPAGASITTTGFTLNTDINEAGKIYYVVVADNATTPTSAEVKAATGNAGSSAVTSGNASVTAGGFTNAFSVTGISAGTAYDVYVVAEDDESTPNLQTSPTKIEVTTIAVPYVNHGSIINFYDSVANDFTTKTTCDNANIETINGITLTPSNNTFAYWFAVAGQCIPGFSTKTPTTYTFSRGVNVVSMKITGTDTWTITPITGTALTFTGSGIISLGFKNITSFTVSGSGSVVYSTTNIIIADDIWTGATDTNWATATNWVSGTIPTNTGGVIIPNVTNKPKISTSTGAVANDITIDASSSLTVESGGSLIIDGTVTVNGDFIAKVNVPNTKWHLVSAPVTGQEYGGTWNTANNIAVNNSNGAIATYRNTSDANGDWGYHLNGSGATTFASGIGYSLKRTSAGDYTFTGKIPSYPINPTITASNIGTANENRWTLVGNPFPAYINISTFLTQNATPLKDTHESIYVWNANAGTAGEYEALTTGQLHPGQAFFVNSNVASTAVTFTKAMQSHQTGVTFYKSSNSKVTLTVSDASETKSTEINYIEDKTTGLDPRFDIGTFTGQANGLNVYSHLVENSEGVNFAKQALPDANYDTLIIPVGVDAEAGNEITFSANTLNLPSDTKVFLEDSVNNIFTRLDEANSTYKVTLNTVLNGIGRFYLHTTNSSLSIDTNLDLKNISIYKFNNSTLRITGLLQNNSNVSIYNILGKQVFNASFISNGVKDVLLPELAKGVYVVKLKTQKGMLSKKIILE